MANIEHREGEDMGRRSAEAKVKLPPLLQFRCDRCGKQVASGGYVSVDTIAAKKRACQRERHSDSLRDSLVWWEVWHPSCDETPKVTDYRIGVERLATSEMLLHTTAELLRNEFWLSETNWSGLIRKVLADTARIARTANGATSPTTEGNDDDD